MIAGIKHIIYKILTARIILKGRDLRIGTLLLFFWFFVLPCFSQATFSTVQDGIWEDGLTWGNASPGTAGVDWPSNIDNAVVSDNITTTGPRTVNDLKINSDGILNSAGGLFSINGNYYNDGTHSSTLVIGLTSAIAGKTIDGNGLTTTSNTFRIYNSNHTVLSSANLTFNCDIVYYSNNLTLTNNGSVVVNGNININTGVTGSVWTNASNSFLGISNSIASQIILNSSAVGNTVEYLGTVQNIVTPSASAYYNLTISGSNTKTQVAALTINGNLHVAGSATLYTSQYQITGNGSGTFQMAGGTTLRLGNSVNATSVAFPTNFITANIALNANSTVIYQSTGNQNISAVPVYGNLTTATAGIKTLSNDITVNGNILIGGGSTLDVSNINNYDITLLGNWDHQGTFEKRLGTIIFSGSNNQTIKSAFSPEDFFNITVNKPAGVVQPFDDSHDIRALNGGDFTILQGTFETAGNNLDVTGFSTISGTLSTNSTTGSANLINVDLSGGTIGSTTSTGAVTISGTLSMPDGNGVIGRVDLTVSGATTVANPRTLSFTDTNGTKIFAGPVTVNGIWNNSANEDIEFRNGLTHSGTSFNSGTGTYSFAANTPQTLDGITDITFNGNVTVSGVGVILNNAKTTIIKGTLGGDGTWNNNSGSVLNYENAIAPMAGGTFSVNTNSNIVNYTSALPQDIRAGNYHNLTTSGGGTKTLLGNTTVSNGILTMTSGNIITGGNILILDNPSPVALSYSSGILIGNFERFINTTGQNYLYPVGTASQIHSLTVNFADLTNGSMRVSFQATDPAGSGLPVWDTDGQIIQNEFNDGFWTALALNSLSSNNYSLTLDATGFNDPYDINSSTRVIKRTDTGAWLVDGSPGTVIGSLLERTGCNGIDNVSGTQFGAGTGNCFVFTDQPDPVTDCQGGSVNFSVSVISGLGGILYQWYKDGAKLSDVGNISGATLNTLSISNLTFSDEASYYCLVTDNCSSQASQAAFLTIPRPAAALGYRFQKTITFDHTKVSGVSD
ncbi:MAG TPA: hypothetical protein VFC41_05260, partial [Anaerovoracaceae bacterium]|nr:hypothetical protein [Anaerovoracaceae bacterium]